MSTSEMINFRAKDEFLVALNRAVRVSGLNRSDFIRQAVERAIESELGHRPVPKATTAAKAKDPKNVSQNKDTCPHANLSKTPFGVNICQDCGARIG